MMEILPLPCFSDNYIWCLRTGDQVWVVDPGDATVVKAALQAWDARLAGILVTHHHADHIGGVAALNPHGLLPVIGPAEAGACITQVVAGGERLALPFGSVDVLPVGAHTQGHVAFYLPAEQRVFCGDALFSAGCGRLFEGTPADLQASLARLARLPDDTWIHPAHEYTAANLRFARQVEPDNPAVDARIAEVDACRRDGRPSLPSRLGDERRFNPFLRAASPTLRHILSGHIGRPLGDETDVLGQLRAWKDVFRG